MNKSVYIIHPIVLFSIGTFIGLSPYIFSSKYFDSYSTFSVNSEILVVYLLGFISFTIGTLFIKFIFKRKIKIYIYKKKDMNTLLAFFLLLSFFLFLKIMSLYGSLPLLALLSGNEDIAFVNQTQKDVGGGIFGVFFLVVMSLIILFPYTVINKNKSLYNGYLFWVHLVLLLLYTTYSGKRQMLFIFFTYTFTYLYLFYIKTNKEKVLQKIKKIGLLTSILLISFFLFLGLLRANLLNEDVSVFNPIIHYSSLPYMNLSNIITHQDQNINAYTWRAFVETLLNDLPSFIKYSFFNEFQTVIMPKIEPTSPSTIYGEIFWGFGYIGVFLYLLVIGIFSNYLYMKAIYAKNFIYITFYSLIVWPLLSIHTYNHFKNFMFLIIPFILIILGNKLYKKIPKKKDKLAPTY